MKWVYIVITYYSTTATPMATELSFPSEDLCNKSRDFVIEHYRDNDDKWFHYNVGLCEPRKIEDNNDNDSNEERDNSL